MSAPEITSAGVTVQTYQEIYDGLVADYRAIYGADINLEPDSPDGQRIGIEAKARLDAQTFGLLLYNQLDPDRAVGTMLQKIIKLSGTTQRAATRSQVDATIVVDRSLTLPAGWTVLDDLRQGWAVDTDTALTAGTHTVTLFATEFGAIEANAGTVTAPATVILGVTSVTNAAPATVGTAEETEPQLRTRRRKSIESPATSSIGGLYAALGNLVGVTNLAIAENESDVYDSELALNRHTLWCVVEGGNVDAIAEIICKNKTGGSGLKGSTSGDWVETITRPDLTTFTVTHRMWFDRPTPVDLYVRLNVHRKDPAISIDAALIKAQLAAHVFVLSEPALSAALYADVFTAGTTFIPSALEISLDGVTWVDGTLSPGVGGKFSITTAHVTVTEI